MRKLKIQDEKEKYTFTIELEKQDYKLLKDYEYWFEGNIEAHIKRDVNCLIQCIKNYERIRENE